MELSPVGELDFRRVDSLKFKMSDLKATPSLRCLT